MALSPSGKPHDVERKVEDGGLRVSLERSDRESGAWYKMVAEMVHASAFPAQ